MDTSLTGGGYTETVETELVDGTRLVPGARIRQGTVEAQLLEGSTLLPNGVPNGQSGTVTVPPGVERPEHIVPRPAAATAADDHPSEYQDEPRRARGPITGPQRFGALLLAAICLVGVAWYVPRIVTADSRSFTGTVTSNGITDLNFASSGRIGNVTVHLGQAVKLGQVLATETSPATIETLSADRATIAADMANIRQLKLGPPVVNLQARLAALAAKLAKDKATLASDRIRLVEAQIMAPSGGTVVAINGQPGETVTENGVHSYSTTGPSSSSASPAFSLLPLGPKTTAVGGTAAMLPMISLRSSGVWLVKILVPQSSVASIKSGERAMVSVPAVHLNNVPGFVQELSPTPVNTPSGVAYEVAISIIGHRRITPLTGMTANVQLR